MIVQSPYFPSPLFPEWQSQRKLDPKCTIEQVQILHRHGSRYPTSDTTEGAPLFGQTIAFAKGNASAGAGPAINATGDLAFLNDWTYELGVEVLVPNGAQELFDSGVRSYYQYGKLYNPHDQSHKPVVRTTSQERMLETARYWTSGFWGLDAPNLINMEVILEGTGFNNTLAPYDTCNNSKSIVVGDSILLPEWKSIYLVNATQRLQPQVSGLNLTTELVYGMQSLCAYETVGLGTSPFCQLFTEEEWQGFEYALDLQYWGDFAFGSPTGRAQGVGLAQEVLARLANTTIPLDQITTQNTSLLNSTYFPLDQHLYVDFTHDDVLQSVLVAFNYTQVIDSQLDPKQNDQNRVYKMSHITPYAARLIYEVATCEDSQGEKNETIIRTVLNDALIPFTEAQGCTPRADGACLLEEFVKYQQDHLLSAANFDFACFGNYTPAVANNGTVWGQS